MITTLAVENYRSLGNIVVPLTDLTVVTGANGSGKSNLYKALRLLADAAHDNIVSALAREGGLQSVLWAGPERTSADMRSGEVPVQGTRRKHPVALRLGFASDTFSYALDLGLPTTTAFNTAFSLDPEIKRESVWTGPVLRPGSLLVDRRGGLVKTRDDSFSWQVAVPQLPLFETVFGALSDPTHSPELFSLRKSLASWRFYDHFRTDSQAATRQAQVGTRTPVLSADGSNAAAAIQTIREHGDATALDGAIGDAFPGGKVVVDDDRGMFSLALQQHGLLRPLGANELSDGTLRYILLTAALLSPQPPQLLVVNEPETSLHPELIPPLARLIARASEETQIVVVSHSRALVDALVDGSGTESSTASRIELAKELGQTAVSGQGALDAPSWHWPAR
jgi:predicted ATPase